MPLREEPSMTEILASIRRILSEEDDYEPARRAVWKEIASANDLVEFVKKRDFEPNGEYGLFTKDASVLVWEKDPNGDEILADIQARNAADGAGNIRVPGTDVELINFSYCPRCSEIHSFNDLQRYYVHPKPVPGVGTAALFRKDTRVSCKACGHYFLPSLVIADGTPVNETQFLCRTQVIEAIETQVDRRVLTRKESNVLHDDKGRKAILNDVVVPDLEPRPGLLVNFLQYMPADQMIAFLNGEHIQRGHVVYGAWA